MASTMNHNYKVLELGDVYFFYRPKVKPENTKNGAHSVVETA